MELSGRYWQDFVNLGIMELIERENFLSILQTQFYNIQEGEGQCVFVSGEAGIGKTSLVRKFSKLIRTNAEIFVGTCDALFTPRPLAPVYDVLLQLGTELREQFAQSADRTELFSSLFNLLRQKKNNTILIFEDIHWADEATLDFIKFLGRRITQLKCLFILTYRDTEIHPNHPLRNVLGQLPTQTCSRIHLPPLSKEAVQKMSLERGYNGEDVFAISGGNPFYVSEILANYSPGVPDNVKDSILAIYNRHQEKPKQLWQILSILPTGLEIKYVEQIAPDYAAALEVCMAGEVIIVRENSLVFKHELYRRAIEDALSPLLRVALNKRILQLFGENFEKNHEIERIIHHAKNANEYDRVVHFAPIAARQAATVGAHLEACKLYLTAIEYYQGNDQQTLIGLYEAYAYECYLTNQVKEAIIYTSKSYNLWKETNEPENIANSLRFLSRLWWFDGNRKKAEHFNEMAIKVLDKHPSSKIKAMTFSNMSQLKMLADQTEECLYWGNKAIEMATELGDDEILAHALNNVGSVHATMLSFHEEGRKQLQESLDLALKNGYHEHAARAFTNISSNAVVIKDYAFAKQKLEEGIQYCEERDLDLWACYMLSWKARLNLETGNWKEAFALAENLLKNNNQSTVVRIVALVVIVTIKIRRGEAGVLPLLLEAEKKTLDTMELQRIIPVLIAFLEYEWLTGKKYIEDETLQRAIKMFRGSENIMDGIDLSFWLMKARNQRIEIPAMSGAGKILRCIKSSTPSEIWKEIGCPFEHALASFEGNDDDKRKALAIVSGLGATAVYEKLKLQMRNSGIKQIPRGIRKSTRSNAAQLTNREIDVLQLLKDGMQNKEIANTLYISAKTVDHHISSILYKLEVRSRVKAVQEAARLEILK